MALDTRRDEKRQIEHVQEDLQREFAALPEAVVAEQVSAVVLSFDHARVRSFVPVLVRREARDKLRHLA
jgi:hypothetical protein